MEIFASPKKKNAINVIDIPDLNGDILYRAVHFAMSCMLFSLPDVEFWLRLNWEPLIKQHSGEGWSIGSSPNII